MAATRILIVEDHPVFARDLAHILTAAGHEITATVPSGEEAIAAVHDRKPDLILMDISLKGEIDGIDAAEQIRQEFDVPVVYLTAYTDPQTLQRAKVAGPFGYLVKPCSEAELRIAVDIALYKWELERCLKESETRYRGIVEDQTEFVCRFLPDTTLTFVNGAYSRYFAKQPEELIGTSFLSYIPETSHNEVREHLASFSRETPLDSLQHLVVVPGGELRWQEWTHRALFDHTGTVVEFQSVGRDITDRRRAEEALQEAHDVLEQRVKERTSELLRANEQLKREIEERERAEQELLQSEEKYRMVIENAHDMIVVAQDEAIRFVNPKCRDLTGYSAEELTSAKFGKWIHPDDRDKFFQAHVRQTRGEETPTSCTLRLVRKDGGVRWVETNVTGMMWEEKPASLAFLSDITDRRQAEEALRESEERFRSIVNSAGDCVFIKNRHGRYTFVNPAMVSILDLPESSIVNRTDAELFGKDVGNHLHSVDARVLNGERIEEERTLPFKGFRATFLITKFPMRDSGGDVVGLCGIAHNITDRKQSMDLFPTTLEEYASRAMRGTIEVAQLAAQSDSIVMLTGESGTGKDYLARYIHDHSGRSGGPFYAINCAAVPGELAESELFGHEAGAFTGARGIKRGLLELAEGGTLLLNEVGELPLTLQAKLLSFLDTFSFTRLGGEESINVRARIIAATNKDLQQEVEAGTFRRDLFFRLNVFSITVPPLRERVEDIPQLLSELVSQLAAEMQLARIPTIDSQTMSKLMRYSWPGNVRELRNVLERALILSRGGPLQLDHVQVGDMEEGKLPRMDTDIGGGSMAELLNGMERTMIEQALDRSGGVKRRAAEILGISRFALARRMEKLGMD